jgi:hypothetical protein
MMGDAIGDGVLRFSCPKCDETLEVGLFITEIHDKVSKKSSSGVHYGHLVQFEAEAPNLHAHFWGHLVRCHQPNPHPYMTT